MSVSTPVSTPASMFASTRAELDRLRYELQLAWKTMLLAPLLMTAPILLLALLQHVYLRQDATRILLAGIEMLLPMAAGIMVATTVAHDTQLELHLTLLRPYRTTSALRIVLLTLWVALLAWAGLSALMLGGQLALPTSAAGNMPFAQLALAQLIWLAPLMWLVGLGACLGLLTQSRTASGALLGGVWLLDVIFVGAIAQTPWLRPFLLFPSTLVVYPLHRATYHDFTMYWLTTRLDLLGMAAAFFTLSWLLLYGTERLLKGASEE